MTKKHKKKETKKKSEIPEIHIEGILSKLSRCKNLSNKVIESHINKSTKVEKSSLKNQWEGYLKNDLLKKLDELKDPDSMVPIYKDLKNLTVILSTLYNKHDKFYSVKLDNAKNEVRKKMYGILCDELKKIKNRKGILEERREEVKSEYIKKCTEKVNELIKEIKRIKLDTDENGKVKEKQFRELKELYQKSKKIAENIKRFNKEKYEKLVYNINHAPNLCYSTIYTYNLKEDDIENIIRKNERRKIIPEKSKWLPEEIGIKKSLNNEILIEMGVSYGSIKIISMYNPKNRTINLKKDTVKEVLNYIYPSLDCLAKEIYKDITNERFIKENLSS